MRFFFAGIHDDFEENVIAFLFAKILREMISFCKDFEENVIVFIFAKILRMVLREIFCKDFEENASRQP